MIAGLPKGEDVNSLLRLTSIPGLGVFVWFGCALFESQRAQGGRIDVPRLPLGTILSERSESKDA